MDNFIVAAVVILIIGGALGYVIKAKSRGVKCIGCPEGEKCGSKNKTSACSGNCSCCGGCTPKNESPNLN
ncbi:MAG: hypothetical protein ACI4VW_06260 [Acutalibacteraceae bacterium]